MLVRDVAVVVFFFSKSGFKVSEHFQNQKRKNFGFTLRTSTRPRRSLDDCIKIPGLVRENKRNTKSQIWIP